MGRYTDRLNQLLEDGVLSQDQYDELADLSVAKEAIKEFNDVKKERDTLRQEVQTFETQPKRKAALEQFGIDYDKSPKYLRQVFDQMDPEKLDDQDYISQHLRDNEVEVNPTNAPADTGERPAAAAIVDHAVASTRTPSQETYEQAVEAAQTPEELDAVYKKFGKEPANA